MLMNITQKSKMSTEEMQRLLTDNSSKMVDILASVAKSNEEMARKTDELLKTTLDIVNASAQMGRASEQANRQAGEAVKYIKRIGRKMRDFHNIPSKDNKSENIYDDLNHTQGSSQMKVLRDMEKTVTGFKQNDEDEILIKQQKESNGSVIADKLQEVQKDLAAVMAHVKQIKEQSADNIRLVFPRIEVAMKNGKLDKHEIYLQISTWIGDLFRTVSDAIYRKFLKSELSELEARLSFCQTILLNLLDFMDFMRRTNNTFWIVNRFEIMDLCSDSAKKILKFLKSKYPRNQKNFKSIEFERMVERVNNSQDPRYDILKNTNIELKHKTKSDKQEVHYIRQIKQLFNILIAEVDKEYSAFHNEMSRIFTNGDKSQEGKLKYLIGKKFKDNTPPFTEEQLSRLDFKCKSPEILRILIKWLEEIEEIVNNTEKQIKNKMVFKDIRLKNTDAFPASQKTRTEIINHLKNKKAELDKNEEASHEILIDLFDNICELVSEKPKGIEFLNIDDVKAIKFSQLLSSCLPFLTINRIEFITTIFRTFQQEFKSKLLESLDLLCFSVFDLLRCKCSGKKDEILAIYERIASSTYMTQIRVKNRLDGPMSDILINCKINNSPIVCEIQLIITNEYLTQKSNVNDHFNHFLYELERSRYGPFSEACLIISAGDPRMSYIGEMRNIRMEMRRLTEDELGRLKLVADDKDDKSCHQNHKLQDLHFSLPFVCCICSGFNSEYSSSFNGLMCRECSLKICPSCIMNNMKQGSRRKDVYLQKVHLTKQFFEQKLIELRKIDPKGDSPLEDVIKKVLKQQGRDFGVLVRFSQGIVTKKGFHLLKQSDSLAPVYFLVKNQIVKLDRVDKYDILLLVKNENTKICSVKDLKKDKNLEFMSDVVDLTMLQPKARQLNKNLICQSFQGKQLIIDYEDVEKDFQKALQEVKLMNVIRECSISKNTLLDLSSRNLTNLNFLQSKAHVLEHVLTINADQNKLTNISVFLNRFPNLRKLSLKENKVNIQQHPIIDIKNDNFIDIFLATNEFDKLPIIKAKKVTRVSFKRNKLVNMDNLPLCEMPCLSEFGVAENEITDVPSFSMPSLEKLIMKSNKITSLQFLKQSKLTSVSKLDFEDNQISIVPPLMFEQLKEIAFRGNKLKSCDWLKQSNIPKLEVLDVSKNEITQIPELNIETLTIINISNNNISSLAFFKSEKLKKLKEFDASHNQITDVPVMNLPLATRINLTSNNISKFPSYRIEGQGEDVNFIDSQLPVLTWFGIVKDNKFEARAIVMMEMERIFEYVKHIQ